MTDIEVAIQLALTDLNQVIERLDALTDQLDPDDDAAQLFSQIVPPITEAMDRLRNNEDENTTITFEAAQHIYNIFGETYWSYKNSLRQIVALKLLIMVMEDK